MAYTKRPLGDFSTSSYSRVLNQLSRITEKSRVNGVASLAEIKGEH
jgi:hypothetical protein